MVRKTLTWLLILSFLLMNGPLSVSAQQLSLPPVGTRLALSPVFTPPLLKGIKVYRNDPFRFDFILDKGDSTETDDQLKTDSNRLIKYFLASLTVPEKDLWVNLSPYEKDRIVPDAFGKTEMGRDLLAQDYILKQITASVIYPGGEVGKAFWAKVYAEAQKRYGTTDVPVDTFNKVWIIPEKATVYENKDAAFVVESRLKVMLEEDYLALENNSTGKTLPATNKLGSDIVREVVIPVLEKEVNEGQNFAPLRQLYHSLILATWYKRKVKASILGQAYADKQKTAGIDIADKNEKEKIWQRYVEAFKKGAYNLIKEEYDSFTKSEIPRKYFSGGTDLAMSKVFKSLVSSLFPNVLSPEAVQVRLDPIEEGSTPPPAVTAETAAEKKVETQTPINRTQNTIEHQTALRLLKEKGFPVFNLDRIADVTAITDRLGQNRVVGLGINQSTGELAVLNRTDITEEHLSTEVDAKPLGVVECRLYRQIGKSALSTLWSDRFVPVMGDGIYHADGRLMTEDELHSSGLELVKDAQGQPVVVRGLVKSKRTVSLPGPWVVPFVSTPTGEKVLSTYQEVAEVAGNAVDANNITENLLRLASTGE